MPDAERATLLIRLAERISIANRLMPIAQRERFPSAKHPPMLWHLDSDWDDLREAELREVCAELDRIIERLKKYR